MRAVRTVVAPGCHVELEVVKDVSDDGDDRPRQRARIHQHMGVSVEPSNSEFTGVQRIDKYAQVRVRIVPDHLWFGLLGRVHERAEDLGQKFPVAAMHPDVVYRQEVVGVPEVPALAPVSRHRGLNQLGTDLGDHISDQVSDALGQFRNERIRHQGSTFVGYRSSSGGSIPGGLIVAAMKTAAKSAACMIWAPVSSSKLSTSRSLPFVIAPKTAK